MQLSEDSPLTQLLVTRYQEGTVWVNHQPYTHPIILSPTQVVPWQGDWPALLNDNPKLVLIGSQAYMRLQTPENLAFFYEKNIGVEMMNLQAACRTYNLLANEGREVIAGLFI